MISPTRALFLLLLITFATACDIGSSDPAGGVIESPAVMGDQAVEQAAVQLTMPSRGPSGEEETSLVTAVPDFPTSQLQVFQVSRTGDLDTMEEHRVIRMLTVFGVGRYYLDGGLAKGMVAEMASRLEQFINERMNKKHVRVHVVVIPVARNQLLPALLEGRGDIVSAGLSITPEREQDVAFSTPVSKSQSEVLVTGPSAPEIVGIEDLAGKRVYLRHSSSYRESIEALSERLVAQGKAAVIIEPVSEMLEDEDLIEMVNGGLLPWAIVDSYKPQMWKNVFDKVTVRDDIVFREGAKIAWAFRKDSPLLEVALSDFMKKNKQGTLLGNMLINRYVRDFDWASNALDDEDYQRFESLVHVFETYGEKYGIDHLMAAAQGYQESRLDQSVRSHAGAVGIMQLLPTTASDPKVGIPDIHLAEDNIHAGMKYMSYLRDRYFSDPEISELDQTLLALGAYNAGPGRMIKLRAKAKERGYDPNVWFDNVELIAAQEIGRETVEYVANIFKYYLAYRMSSEQALRHKAAKEIVRERLTEAL
ncbi:MAG: membrane-bound lytic murein transglycosylase MltF [Halioglobus sp.]|jgi:membrane-bound lytic murein transglycosylase MltF